MTLDDPGVLPPEPGRDDDPQWLALLEGQIDAAPADPATSLDELYGPLRAVRRDGPFAIGHLAQSLDGCIATASGMSRWLSGDGDLLHTHRMRALCDAVVVGVDTVLNDNPQLTVRRCA